MMIIIIIITIITIITMMIIIRRRRTMMITIVSLRELHGRNSQLLPQCFRAASAQLPRTFGASTNPIIMNEIPLRPPIASAQLPRSFRIPSADPVENL